MLFRSVPNFRGEFCNPLSPNKGFPETLDQFYIILHKFGTPSEKETSFITNESNLNYIRSFGNIPKTQITQLIRGINKLEEDLLSKMLEFNPYLRISAKDCLDHSYFKNVVDKVAFEPSRNIINIDFDFINEIQFNDVIKVIKEELEFYKAKNENFK